MEFCDASAQNQVFQCPYFIALVTLIGCLYIYIKIFKETNCETS